MLSKRYGDLGNSLSLYLWSHAGPTNMERIVRPNLSGLKIRAFRGMAVHEPVSLVNLRSKINGQQAWHNLRWIRKEVS